jgi:hypothetical protein
MGGVTDLVELSFGCGGGVYRGHVTKYAQRLAAAAALQGDRRGREPPDDVEQETHPAHAPHVIKSERMAERWRVRGRGRDAAWAAAITGD